MVHLWDKDERFRPAADPMVLLPVEVEHAVDDGHCTKPVVARGDITSRNGRRLVVTDSVSPTAIADLVGPLEAF